MSMPTPPSPSSIAYLDESFLTSDAARPLRILAEYLEPLEAFRREQIKDTIVFFGSARLRENGPLGRYYEEARRLARLITEWSMSLPLSAHHYVVCSGGGGGIMEAANRGAADAGGRSIGLNIGLPHEQRPNPYITPGLAFEFHYFFMRKLWFAHLAKALIVFPGGFGTLDELMEILTLAQTHKLERKIQSSCTAKATGEKSSILKRWLATRLSAQGTSSCSRSSMSPLQRSLICSASWRSLPDTKHPHSRTRDTSSLDNRAGRGCLLSNA